MLAKKFFYFIIVLAVVFSFASFAHAQPTYSIDVQGPTIGAVTEGDILTPAAPGLVPPPLIVHTAASLGLTGPVEVDALSYAMEPILDPGTGATFGFSVDEFAIGLPPVPAISVTTEAALGEAAADIFGSVPIIGPAPLAPGPNFQVGDGNGSTAGGGNLVEPIAPGPGFPDSGDNLDAFDFDTPVVPTGDTGTPLSPPVYFSLDASFTDPLEGPGINTGSAVANGYVGGDVIVTTLAGGPTALYAAAVFLGLDGGGIVEGHDEGEDDLDALILWDDGDGIYDPVVAPYSWLTDETDMLLYSVRRGSAVIGTPDALGSGLLIEESDILVPVLVAPGVWAPGIWVPGENLGLATLRSGIATVHGDDLNALDVVIPEPTVIAVLTLGSLLLVSRKRNVKAAR